MRILVKLGGALLDSVATRDALAAQIAAAVCRGLELVVVHGGGRQMTRFLAERGVESRFVNGLRVTTPEVLDAVLKVFAGTVNHELVAAINRAGGRAVGLSGVDAHLVEAEQMDSALGWVGRVTRCNPELLHVLVRGGFTPVVACVAGDRGGNIYNVNADQMAVACASAYGARQLVFLTDVEGVLDKDKRILPSLSAAEGTELITTGVATGGMQAKLEASIGALRGGVDNVRIAPGSAEHILERILAGEPVGTRLLAREPQTA